MTNIIIIADSWIYSREKHGFTIGGVQTYILDLCAIAGNMGARCTVALISPTKEIFSERADGFDIEAFHKSGLFKSTNQATFEYIYKKFNSPDSIFIISTDQLTINTRYPNVITIQHGIAFDNELKGLGKPWNISPFTKRLFAHLRAERNYKRGISAPNIVCVDYNYFNWVRTLGDISSSNHYKVILNHTSSLLPQEEIHEKLRKTDGPVKLIFARRFVDYRGARIFANAVSRLFDNGYDIKVTFAGDGPLGPELKERFKGNPNVDFTSFKPHESVGVHAEYDIAVVPTVFSEGSSLSLAEAMSAGCLPVVSHVGGMTNMLLDGFNGLLAYPSEDSLYEKLCQAIDLPVGDFNRIQMNAYLTAKNALNLQKWQAQWIDLIQSVYQNYKNQ